MADARDQSRSRIGVEAFFPLTIEFGPPRLLWWGVAITLGLSFLLGGGTTQGLRSDAFIQLVSLALLALAAWRVGRRGFVPGARGPSAIIAALLVLVGLHLIAVPPSVWTRLPGRATIEAAYIAAHDTLSWLPFSLDPQATWRAALSLIPPIGVFFAIVQLSARSRRSLSLLFVAFGLFSVLVGLAQLMLGAGSSLYLYPITNEGSSVGFFANRNHYAAFLYSAIPLTGAWVVGLLGASQIRAIWIIVFVLMDVGLLLGIGMSQSRAGLFLGGLAVIGNLALVTGGGKRTQKLALAAIGAVMVIAGVLVIQFGLSGILNRLDTGVLADARFIFAAVTADAAKAFQPVGSGFGTFPVIYQMFERPEDLITTPVNHAHNDWLEVWLEGGWIAIALALAFIVWFGRTSVKLWRDSDDERRPIDRALARAATMVVPLLLLHSTVDYPLRTTAISCAFAFACALIIEPPRQRERRRPGDTAGDGLQGTAPIGLEPDRDASRPDRRTRSSR